MNTTNIVYKIYRKLFCNQGIYINKIDDKAPWALVSYIPFVFYHKDENELLDRHQSHREAFVINEVLSSLGYNVFNIAFGYEKPLPDIDFKLIFGLEPVFCKACRKYKNAIKIYYATGAFVGHQNRMVKSLTDTHNAKYHSTIPYRRTAPDNDGAYIADHILQIGSSYTIETYPKELRNKITKIHQSSQAIRELDNIDYAHANEYFFMSSSGNILKGLPQIIECFSRHTDKIVHIVGPIEDDVMSSLNKIITENIIFHGFMNVNSDEYLNIIKRCNFTIYPSSSEGGVPGGVLNCMKNGLIPIASRWSSFDDISDYGYILNGITSKDLDEALEWSLTLTSSEISSMKYKCKSYVENNYNLTNFFIELKDFFKNITNHESTL